MHRTKKHKEKLTLGVEDSRNRAIIEYESRGKWAHEPVSLENDAQPLRPRWKGEKRTGKMDFP